MYGEASIGDSICYIDVIIGDIAVIDKYCTLLLIHKTQYSQKLLCQINISTLNCLIIDKLGIVIIF